MSNPSAAIRRSQRGPPTPAVDNLGPRVRKPSGKQAAANESAQKPTKRPKVLTMSHDKDALVKTNPYTTYALYARTTHSLQKEVFNDSPFSPSSFPRQAKKITTDAPKKARVHSEQPTAQVQGLDDVEFQQALDEAVMSDGGDDVELLGTFKGAPPRTVKLDDEEDLDDVHDYNPDLTDEIDEAPEGEGVNKTTCPKLARVKAQKKTVGGHHPARTDEENMSVRLPWLHEENMYRSAEENQLYTHTRALCLFGWNTLSLNNTFPSHVCNATSSTAGSS